jgi:hypothetical protein
LFFSFLWVFLSFLFSPSPFFFWRIRPWWSNFRDQRSQTAARSASVDFHGAFGADSNDIRDWLNKDEGESGYQSLTKEEISHAEAAGSSEEDEENEKPEVTCKIQIFRSKTKLGLHHQFCGL